ncbi:MAG TPA: hypothetical protein VNZ53_54775 [Steroidobacteraceae bacterium]|nr:hypothetical protein [Steroidobacteraceae bacterium]
MSGLIQMYHHRGEREELLGVLGPYIVGIIACKTGEEDRSQGKAGLILSLCRTAFRVRMRFFASLRHGDVM